MTSSENSIHNGIPENRYERYYEKSHPIESLSETPSDILEEAQDHRTPAQRDRDRILHSSALKRLAGVTQVVDPAEGQLFHNRLTHSLKVSQIARRIAEKFLFVPDTQHIAQQFDINPDIVEAAALAHDLGHPPFGHIAEQELKRLLNEHKLPDLYEGNAQTFRILNKLEVRRPGVLGLDLTRATLNAVMKYPWQKPLNTSNTNISEESDKKNEKWGCYLTETEQFDWVRQGWGKEVRCVEAEIMDFADDIAYSLHDLADFSRAGLIPIDRLISNRTIRRQFVEDLLTELKIIQYPDLPSLDKSEKEKQENIVYELVDFLILAPMTGPLQATGDSQAIFHSWQSLFITRYVNSISLIQDALTDISISPTSVPKNISLEIELLKAITKKYVINSRQLATQQHGKRQVINNLFTTLMMALEQQNQKGKKHNKYVLPEDHDKQIEDIRNSLEVFGITDEKAIHARFVADMISSMTDTEALALHKRLTGINPGSVLDIVVYSGFHLH